MTPSDDIRIIINPSSASGRTGRNLPAIIRALMDGIPHAGSPVLTRGPGHAGVLAGEAVRSRLTMVVAVGGDGTINEVVNGMLSASGGGTPGTLLGIVSSGSGSGFAMSLGLPRDLGAQVRILRDGTCRSVDAGFLEPGPRTGRLHRRYFINECQIGIGAEVVRRNAGLLKAAGGRIGYGAATISSLFRMPNARCRVTVDEAELDESLILGLSVGNGARTGGGMSLTPGADLADGLLDLLVIHGQSIASRIVSFPRIYRGTHVHSRHFSYRKAHSILVEGENGFTVAVDGELMGGIPCAIGILPAALNVACPNSGK